MEIMFTSNEVFDIFYFDSSRAVGISPSPALGEVRWGQSPSAGGSRWGRIQRLRTARHTEAVKHHVHTAQTQAFLVGIQVPARHACQENLLVFTAGEELLRGRNTISLQLHS